MMKQMRFKRAMKQMIQLKKIQLSLFQVYQFRHPDITSNAYVVFAFVAVGLIFEAIGYYSHDAIFWTMFIVSYLFLLVVFIIEVYFNGDTRAVMADIWRNIIGNQAEFLTRFKLIFG